MTTHVLIPTCGIPLAVKSLQGHLKHVPSAKVVVVENDPDALRSNKVRQVLSQWEGATHIGVAKRIGYVDAINLAYRAALPCPGDYVAVLNDDLEVLGDWITPLQAELARHPNVVQVGPSVKGVGTDGRWGDRNSKYNFVEGWCWMARAGDLGRDAVYDRAFSPGYCEDMDLSICLVESSGGKVRQVDVPLRHERSQTFKEREPFWGHNRRRLQLKHRLA